MELVIARHNESISWLHEFSGQASVAVQVYDKGGDSGVAGAVRLLNVGREAHTYAHHIVSRYDSLADFTWFLQGRVDDHDKRGIETIKKADGCAPFVALGAHGRWGPHGLEIVDLHCGVHTDVRPVMLRVFRGLFGESTEPPHRYRFMPGALFGASRDAIRARSLSFWKRLLAMLENDVNPPEGFAAERLWPVIFDPTIRDASD